MNLKIILTLLSFMGFAVISTAQDRTIIEESDSIKEIMKIKEEVIKSEKCYQIQIFNGRLDSANEVLKTVKDLFPFPINMSFETPNYKVRLGKFRTRMEAEKLLPKVKENYPSAFVMFI